MDRADVAIEQWARERPDLPSLPMAVIGRLSEAAERVMRDHLDPLFAGAGLQPGEFDVISTLRRKVPEIHRRQAKRRPNSTLWRTPCFGSTGTSRCAVNVLSTRPRAESMSCS